MAHRSTVPPRRDAIFEQYTGAHEAACLAKDDAEKLQGWAEAAHDRRDYAGASHFWDRCIRHTDTCRGHREKELELRKEEYSLYNHLDPEEERDGLYKLIGYCERRIERLRTDLSKRLCKSRIAFLKEGVVRQEMKARLIEKQIIEEDLKGKAKGRANISFGNGWDDMREGWGPRQPQRRDVKQNIQSQAANKLSYLEGQRDYALRKSEQNIEEIRSNEEEWENTREQERAREAQWTKLDADARRQWAALPVRDYQADAFKALEQRKKEEEAARIAREKAEQERNETLRLQRIEEQKIKEAQRLEALARKAEEDAASLQQAREQQIMQNKQAEEQARWQEDYALEEDPDFINPPIQSQVPDLSEQPEPVSTTSNPLPSAEVNVLDLISAALPKNRPFAVDEDVWQADFDKALAEGEAERYTMQLDEQTNEDIAFAMEYLEENAYTDVQGKEGHVIDYSDGFKL